MSTRLSSTASLTPDPTLLPAQPAYHTQIITSMEAFAALSTQWDAFLKTASIDNLCMTHQWLKTWLQHFPPSELQVIIVTDQQGQWMGLAPFQIAHGRTGYSHRLLRHVQFIGTQPTVFDWMQLAMNPEANQPAVIDQIAKALKKSRWDLLDLWFCKQDSQLESLCLALRRKPTASVIFESTSIPYLPLTETAEDYAKNRRKKTRLELNRHRNNITQAFGEAPSLEFLPSSAETETVLDTFINNHIAYWAGRNSKSDFKRFPALPQFYKDMLRLAKSSLAKSPHLVFSVFRFKGEAQPVSYHLGFAQNTSYLSHINSYNHDFQKYSPGTLHMDALIFDALAKELPEFEFGRGDEPYKKMWTKEQKKLWGIRLFRNPFSHLIWNVDIILKKLSGRSV